MAGKNEIDTLLAQVPVGDLAQRFGVDESTVEAAVRQALPGLLGGMAVNASDDDGADRLARAARQHEPAAKSGSRLDLQAIDTDDGQKIVKHVLGDKQGEVAQALGSHSGDSTIADLIPKLLPILAPIIMQFLAGRLGGSGGSGASGNTAGSGVGGVLGDLLGGLLGGGSGGSRSGSNSDGGLGDLLGGLLGGGSGTSGSAKSGSSSSGGGLGDLLGGLLGR